jgi:hypothetical protein
VKSDSTNSSGQYHLYHYLLQSTTINMLSWERTRFIPWSHMPQGGLVSDQKERIFGQLQREADRQEKERT